MECRKQTTKARRHKRIQAFLFVSSCLGGKISLEWISQVIGANAARRRPALRRFQTVVAGAAALAILQMLAACATARREVLSASGWAWPLPPPSMRSPEFLERMRAEAERARVLRAIPWADQEAIGRGSARAGDPAAMGSAALAEALSRVQAREAARRQLAEGIAALPLPSRAGAAGPAPRLGDPGALPPGAIAQLNDWIASVPIRREAKSSDGQAIAEVTLPLLNVARLALGESVPAGAEASSAKQKEISPAENAANMEKAANAANSPNAAQVSKAGGKWAKRSASALPPPDAEEWMAAAKAIDSESSASSSSPAAADKTPAANSDSVAAAWAAGQLPPEARNDALRRAEAMARRNLLEEIRQRPIGRPGQTLGLAMDSMSDVRRLVNGRVETAPVRSQSWDSLGRCRVIVTLDWTSLAQALVAQDARTSGRGAARGGAGGAGTEPLPLP